MEIVKQIASANFAALAENPYPGRIIIAGLDETGKNLVQVYVIMGRSENSRNRVFGCEGKRLFTEAADPSKVKDPSLIIYNAMDQAVYGEFTIHVVSNGHQTDDVVSSYRRRRGLHETMHAWSYEPDSPNFTPRITASSYWSSLKRKPVIRMSLLRKSQWSAECDRHFFQKNDVGAGYGYCLTTYRGDGSPLPPFRGEPYLLPLRGDAQSIAQTYWEALNADNRVSLAVKFIPEHGASGTTTIINKYEKVG